VLMALVVIAVRSTLLRSAMVALCNTAVQILDGDTNVKSRLVYSAIGLIWGGTVLFLWALKF
jgi:hypothetical protein